MGAAPSRVVRLGMVDIIWPFATHWAVQVDDEWFEVQGASKQDARAPMNILTSRGERSAVGDGADVGRFGHVGETKKSNLEIFWFIQRWKWNNPRYGFDSDNCREPATLEHSHPDVLPKQSILDVRLPPISCRLAHH